VARAGTGPGHRDLHRRAHGAGAAWKRSGSVAACAQRRAEIMNAGMLVPPGPIRALMAAKPVDFRKGVNGLAALVKEQLRADPFSGVIYVFRSK
jgi:hypothetical protein